MRVVKIGILILAVTLIPNTGFGTERSLVIEIGSGLDKIEHYSEQNKVEVKQFKRDEADLVRMVARARMTNDPAKIYRAQNKYSDRKLSYLSEHVLRVNSIRTELASVYRKMEQFQQLRNGSTRFGLKGLKRDEASRVAARKKLKGLKAVIDMAAHLNPEAKLGVMQNTLMIMHQNARDFFQTAENSPLNKQMIHIAEYLTLIDSIREKLELDRYRVEQVSWKAFGDFTAAQGNKITNHLNNAVRKIGKHHETDKTVMNAGGLYDTPDLPQPAGYLESIGKF